MFNFFSEKINFFKQEKDSKLIDQLQEKLENIDFQELEKEAFNLKEKIEKFVLESGDREKAANKFLIEVYSICKEFIRREKGISLFPTQIFGSIVLNNGDVCQMNTGEGKTLTAILPACLNAIVGNYVYVITTNEYLAKRDWQTAKPLFDFFKINSDVNLSSCDLLKKKNLYENSKIIYTTGNEICYDYLRYNLLNKSVSEKCSINFDFAIIDEVDSILVDSSQTPLAVSITDNNSKDQNQQNEKFELVMNEVKKLVQAEDYEVDFNEKVIFLKDSGVKKIEKKFKVKNFFSFENSELNFLIFSCLKSIFFYKKGFDYVVDKEKEKIQIIDAFTGRISHNKIYSYGIQQFIEVKESIKTSKGRTISGAKITFPTFFRMFKKISGMSGTADYEKKEFKNIYGMNVVKVPPYKKLSRIDKKDLLFFNNKTRFEAVLNLIKENIKNKKRPILIGVHDLNSSEQLSKILDDSEIKHSKLNAISHESEAEIISKAGQIGSIMIATNMAGRGTDIVLTKESIENGGLLVIILGRSSISRRLDDQFIGRSGRQGNPGETQFYLSLEDEIFKMPEFASDSKEFNPDWRFSFIFNSLLEDEKNFISSKVIDYAVFQIQNLIKTRMYNSRRYSLEHELSINNSKKEFYNYREKILTLEEWDLIDFLIEIPLKISDLDSEDREFFVLLVEKIRKYVLSKADIFWFEYLERTEKILKTIFVKSYFPKSPQESFFLKVNQIFNERFDIFKLIVKERVLVMMKKFFTDLKFKMVQEEKKFSISN